MSSKEEKTDVSSIEEIVSASLSTEDSLDTYLASISSYLTKEEDKILTFDNDNIDGFHLSNGYKNGDPFDCYWKKESSLIENGNLSLVLSKEGDKYYSGEIRSRNTYSHGYFSVSMKGVKHNGVISSFFAYIGQPWDEIDIEFLGDKENVVQFNYYHNGVGKHEFLYELGFDWSLDFHEYAFYWDEKEIVWFVDGTPVHYTQAEIPQASMKIYANLWNGKGEDFIEWCGLFEDDGMLSLTAQYEWFGYSARSLTKI